METEKYILRQQTLRRYILAMARRGAAGIITDRGCRRRYLVLVVIITLVIMLLMRPSPDNVLWQVIPTLLNLAWTAVWLALCAAAIPACGYIPGSWGMYDDLTRAGIVNYAGEAPLLIQRKMFESGVTELIYQIKGYPLTKWEENRTLIESALNVSIVSIQQGADNQTYVLHTVPACKAFGEMVKWKNHYRPGTESVLALGVDAAGMQVTINLSKTPHWLIGAATGGGKTVLLQLILHQLQMAKYTIYLADYKGVDFDTREYGEGHYADNNLDLIAMLQKVVTELDQRRAELAKSHSYNIDVYNATAHTPLPRIVVVIDETSMILDATGRSKEEKAEINEILNLLLTIGRLGRAMGIHLIVATQRPDVGSVPGALKAQLDGRICGHTADAQSSIVILDDGSGAKLPAIPGRFIIRDGSGSDRIIQSYFFDQRREDGSMI